MSKKIKGIAFLYVESEDESKDKEQIYRFSGAIPKEEMASVYAAIRDFYKDEEEIKPKQDGL